MSAWDQRTVNGGHLGVEGPFAAQLRAFVDWQVARWPRLAEARAGLRDVAQRSVQIGDRTLVVQFNPARAVSTTAKVDATSIQARPCFLCPANLPPEEHGLPFGAEWVVLPNPAPILMDHLVIAHRSHRSQLVRDALPALLDFAVAAEGTVSALYNGPKSGASAPDHLHLQAVAGGALPEEQRVLAARSGGRVPGASLGEGDGFVAWRAVDAGRDILGLAGTRAGVERGLRDAIGALGGEEPALNLIARTHGDGELMALLFPRGAHRPAAFFAEGPSQRLISPGVIDMAGVIVTVRRSDFDAVTDEEIAGIYRQVTLASSAPWFAALERRWSSG